MEFAQDGWENQVYQAECADMMSAMEPESVDLTVTSPPYDDLREYHGYEFSARAVISGLHRVTKKGGVCVWVVGDKVNGGHSLTSFRQGLMFAQAGWTMHDVMIYQKKNVPFTRPLAYTKSFEYMFVASRGKPKTFNPIRTKSKWEGHYAQRTARMPDGSLKKLGPSTVQPTKVLGNVWAYSTGLGNTTCDKYAFEHPAMFPEKLAEDHVRSWSNPGDLVFDPMCGSGTTLKMAKMNGRRWLGCDVSEEYKVLAERRVADAKQTKFS